MTIRVPGLIDVIVAMLRGDGAAMRRAMANDERGDHPTTAKVEAAAKKDD
jgi:hypothetical protein